MKPAIGPAPLSISMVDGGTRQLTANLCMRER